MATELRQEIGGGVLAGREDSGKGDAERDTKGDAEEDEGRTNRSGLKER